MNRFLAALAPTALLAVAGCAAPFQAQVSRFQQMPAPQGQTFAVVADNPRLNGSLEFSQYANSVSQRLSSYGYVQASSPSSANLIVHLDYGVDKGREKIRSVPGSAFGPRFGYAYGWGPYRPYWGFGRRAWVYGFDDPFLYGSSYDEVESYTIYNSELTMRIDRKGGERVFEGAAKAMSSDNDLTSLVPNLIEAMFTGFPGNSGQTVRITVAPPEKQRR
jgi:hypothetical protein